MSDRVQRAMVSFDRWLGRNIARIWLAVTIALPFAFVASLVTPIQLVLKGTSADGVVTDVDEGEEGSTATIQLQAGTRIVTIERRLGHSSSGDIFSSRCIGCYDKGERVRLLYLPDDPRDARVAKFMDLWAWPTALLILAIMFFVAWRLRAAAGRAGKP